MTTRMTQARTSTTYRQEYRRGVLAIAPLWIAAVPFGVAIGISAKTAGFSSIESVALSVLVFAGAAQIAIISLFSGGAGFVAIILTTLFLNLRHVFYGLSLSRQLETRTRPGRPVLAFFMIDEAYGLTTRDHHEGRGGHAFYFGASSSLYLVYCLSTFAGVLLGSILPEPETIGLDVIFPLLFVGLLVPLLKTRVQLIVAGIAGAMALGLGQVASGGTTILATIVVAATLGAILDRS
jgi:4-azaleucine resistance transporter AzlC